MEFRKSGKKLIFLRFMSFLITVLDLVLVRYSSIPIHSVNDRKKIDVQRQFFKSAADCIFRSRRVPFVLSCKSFHLRAFLELKRFGVFRLSESREAEPSLKTSQ